MKQLNNKELTVVIVTVVVIVGSFAYGRGLFGNRGSETPASDIPIATPASTSSTIPQLEGRDYQRGQCVTWDQSEAAQGNRITNVVPCAEEHLFEYVTSKTTGEKFDAYPTAAQLDEITKTLCTKPVNDYLGYVLDPAGRFFTSSLRPTEETWANGDRDFQCGISANSLVAQNKKLLVPFTGVVKGVDQNLLYPIGACVNVTSDGSTAVDCAQPWRYVVTGNVELTGTALPSSGAEWDRQIGAKCSAVGKSARPDLYKANRVGWFSFEQSSWDIGRRTVQCSLSA